MKLLVVDAARVSVDELIANGVTGIVRVQNINANGPAIMVYEVDRRPGLFVRLWRRLFG